MLEDILKKANWTDVFIIFIGAIAIIGIWRGSWNLMDEFLLPKSFVLSQIVSILAGVFILILLAKVKN